METIQLKPIEIFFCNINKDMNLTGHCHYAEVIIEFETLGEIGFPAFKDTFLEVESFVQGLKLTGLKMTNEGVLRFITEELEKFDYPATKKYSGKFKVCTVTLKIMGVQDENNHANGFTTYTKIVHNPTPAVMGTPSKITMV